MFADSSNSKKNIEDVRCQMSGVRCQVSGVTCHTIEKNIMFVYNENFPDTHRKFLAIRIFLMAYSLKNIYLHKKKIWTHAEKLETSAEDF